MEAIIKKRRKYIQGKQKGIMRKNSWERII